MKKILLVSIILCASFLFTNCKKKSDPIPNTPVAPTVASGSVTLVGQGITENLTISTSTSGSYYAILGSLGSPPFYLEITFPSGKPTGSKTITLSGSSSDPIISLQDAISEYTATSATIKITVIGTTVSVDISNATFKDDNSSATMQVTGTLVTLN